MTVKCVIFLQSENLDVHVLKVNNSTIVFFTRCIYFTAGVIDDLKLNWTVQRQKRYGFSGTACDQTIEQTCNRDAKTKGYYSIICIFVYS